jgi:hypothetical protein
MIRDLNAVLTVAAKGYEVNIKVNGTDIGVAGGKSESFKLFGKTSPSLPVLPADMQKQVCLEEGENSILVTYKRVSQELAGELTVELATREQFVNGATLISKKEKSPFNEEKSFYETFTL